MVPTADVEEPQLEERLIISPTSPTLDPFGIVRRTYPIRHPEKYWTDFAYQFVYKGDKDEKQ